MNNNNNINNPSQETMNRIKSSLKAVHKRQRQTIEAINKTPFVQKMIITIVLVTLLVIFIKHLFNRKKKKNTFNPYYLDTINNMSSQNSVFNGSIVNSNCLKTDCATNTNYTNTESCCIIDKSNFKEENIGYMTFSFWIYIYSFDSGNTNNRIEFLNLKSEDDEASWKHIWHRGNDVCKSGNDYDDSTIQYPGVWLSPNLETISFDFNNGEDTLEKLELPISEYNKWTNYSLVLNNNILSVYQNGKLENTIMLNQKTISFKNFNVYLGTQGLEGSGFPGYLAYFTYFNDVYNSDVIYDLYKHYKKKMDKYIKLENDYLTSQMLEPILISDKDMD